MNDELLEQQVREIARRIARGDAPGSLHTRVAAIPYEHPRRQLASRHLPPLRLGVAVAASVILAVVALLLVSTLPPNDVLAPGATSQATPSAALTPSPPASAAPAPTLATSVPILLPDGLTNKAWAEMGPLEATAPYAVGLLDNSAHLTLPSNERVLAVGDGRVASETTAFDTIVVRDVASGQRVAQYAQPGAHILLGALGTSDLYFVMQPVASSPASGVYTLDLASGQVTTLLAPDAGRNSLALSPSGKTLVSEIGFPASSPVTELDIINLPSGTHTRIQVQGTAQVVSDGLVVTYDARNLYAYLLASGRTAWTIPDLLFDRGYLTTDGARLVMQTGMDPNTVGAGRGLPAGAQTQHISIASMSSGSLRTLVTVASGRPAYYLWTQVSGDTAAVLLTPAGFPQQEFQIGGGALSASVLDLATGKVTPHALTITQASPTGSP